MVTTEIPASFPAVVSAPWPVVSERNINDGDPSNFPPLTKGGGRGRGQCAARHRDTDAQYWLPLEDTTSDSAEITPHPPLLKGGIGQWRSRYPFKGNRSMALAVPPHMHWLCRQQMINGSRMQFGMGLVCRSGRSWRRYLDRMNVAARG